MADYFTNFSFIVTLTGKQPQAYALKLFQQMRAIQQGDDVPSDFPENLRAACEDCSFEADADEPNGLWLHSSSGGVDGVCAYVQHLIQQFNLQPIAFEWSHDCSKPRIDAYGGGAAYITAQKIKTFNTTAWLRRQTRTLNPR